MWWYCRQRTRTRRNARPHAPPVNATRPYRRLYIRVTYTASLPRRSRLARFCAGENPVRCAGIILVRSPSHKQHKLSHGLTMLSSLVRSRVASNTLKVSRHITCNIHSPNPNHITAARSYAPSTPSQLCNKQIRGQRRHCGD